MRLAKSNYRERFILKGAVLLSKYIPLGRETKDLDFLAKGISNRVDDLSLIFEEVSKIEYDDGFTFQNVKVDQLAHPHMRYSGAEISAMAYFGEIKRKLSIDIGFGDAELPQLRTYWQNYLNGLKIGENNFPKSFDNLLSDINEWLTKNIEIDDLA